MSTLTVYDAQGNEYSPTGDATGTNQRIKEMALASMRVAIKPTERQVTGYFRAKETPNSRAEQFYGEYTDRNTAEPLTDFVNAVRTQIDEWNHTLDESDDSMAVFNALTNQRRATVPGSEKDIRILEELAGDREVTAVGVSGANEAVGLLQEFADQHSVAIADSTNTDALSEFDIVIVTGRHQGIEPVGQTTGRWKEAKQSLKQELVGEEISSITESVRTLKRDFGLSSGEIQRKVSGLEAPGSSGGGRSQLSGSASTGEKLKQTLLSPQVGKYMFIGAIVLIVLIGGVWGAGTFLGIGPFSDKIIISGTVYGAADGDNVVLESPSGETRTALIGAEGEYAFSETAENASFELNTSEEYIVRVQPGESYEPMTNVSPPNTDVDFGTPSSDTQANNTDSGLFSNLPFIGEGDSSSNNDNETTDSGDINNESIDDSGDADDNGDSTTDGGETQMIAYVEGKVVNQDGEPVKFVNVTALDQEGNELPDTQNESALNTGKYRVENIPFEGDLDNGELVLKAEKEGQIESTTKSVDLSPYTTPEDGIEGRTDIVVKEI